MSLLSWLWRVVSVLVVSANIPVCYASRPACSHLHFRVKCTFTLVGRLSVLDDKLDKVGSRPGIFYQMYVHVATR